MTTSFLLGAIGVPTFCILLALVVIVSAQSGSLKLPSFLATTFKGVFIFGLALAVLEVALFLFEFKG